MPVSTKLDQVCNRVAIEVGNVAAEIEVKDIDPYISTAAIAYYTAVPIQRMWKIPTTYGTSTLDINAVKAQFWPAVQDPGPPEVLAEADLYYFLGPAGWVDFTSGIVIGLGVGCFVGAVGIVVALQIIKTKFNIDTGLPQMHGANSVENTAENVIVKKDSFPEEQDMTLS